MTKALNSKTRACDHCKVDFETFSNNKAHCSAECRMRSIAQTFADVEGCWEWPLSRNVRNGYGQLGSYEGGRHKIYAAHVLSFSTFVGQPGGLFVCHHCDNRGCFKPGHLFLGSARDNYLDAKLKNRPPPKRRPSVHWTQRMPERIPRGEAHASKRRHPYLPCGTSHHNAKLTESAVMEIRASSETHTALAKRFGVTISVIAKARSGETWRHVGDQPNFAAISSALDRK